MSRYVEAWPCKKCAKYGSTSGDYSTSVARFRKRKCQPTPSTQQRFAHQRSKEEFVLLRNRHAMLMSEVNRYLCFCCHMRIRSPSRVCSIGVCIPPVFVPLESVSLPCLFHWSLYPSRACSIGVCIPTVFVPLESVSLPCLFHWSLYPYRACSIGVCIPPVLVPLESVSLVSDLSCALPFAIVRVAETVLWRAARPGMYLCARFARNMAPRDRQMRRRHRFRKVSILSAHFVTPSKPVKIFGNRVSMRKCFFRGKREGMCTFGHVPDKGSIQILTPQLLLECGSSCFTVSKFW